jgi:serine/threonine protein kinase
MAVVTREPRTADVVADAPGRALFIPTAAFDQLASRHLQLATLMTDLVADRLGQAARDGFGGKQMEGFRILRCIGRGGMSVVYRAQDESTGELVALKMMSYRLIYDSPALARFRREADLVQQLDHPNIARLERLFPAYRTYFLVMELCDGVDLNRLIKARGPLPEVQVRAILGQLAGALEYVHGRGVVHRDLKPANVMITRQGEVKLTDFGIAVPAVSLDMETPTGEYALLGTPAFMAPEQLSGGSVDGRADVYALGCLVYELLTGQPLFRATNLLDLIQQKLAPQLPALDGMGPISSDVREFLRSALRVIPAERPSSLARIVRWAARCEPPPEELLQAGDR